MIVIGYRDKDTPNVASRASGSQQYVSMSAGHSDVSGAVFQRAKFYGRVMPLTPAASRLAMESYTIWMMYFGL